MNYTGASETRLSGRRFPPSKALSPAGEVAAYFLKARTAKIAALLVALVKLGLAKKEGEHYKP